MDAGRKEDRVGAFLGPGKTALSKTSLTISISFPTACSVT